MGYAFISYSTQNQAYADAMRELFQRHNIDTWMAPYDIPGGSKYAAVITKAIRNCSCFVLLLSNDSQASEAVDSEVELAALTFKKTIITVELEKVILNDAFTFYIHNKQIIALHKIDESAPEAKQVLTAVKAYTGESEKNRESAVLVADTASEKASVETHSGRTVPDEPIVEEYQFDFFEYIRQEFAENFSSENTGQPENTFSPDIVPAQIRRKCEHFSCNFSLIDQEGLISRAFAVEEYLVKEKNQWHPMLKFRALPYSQENTDSGSENNFQCEIDYFTDDPEHHGIILTAKKDGSSSFLNSYMLRVSQPDTSDFFVSKAPHAIGRVYIDTNGFPQDPRFEALFADFGFEPVAQQPSKQTVQWRKATSAFNPEYLRYLILDMQTMKEIPKSFSRNHAGEYQMHLMIPCPGMLGITEAVFDESINSDIMAVSGYLHGRYGLKQNQKAAQRLMEQGAQAGDPQMSFEYGTLLMQNGRIQEAEKHLRFAADNNIPGAVFELARLLKERGTASDKTEAELLIYSLCQQGYRTYGTEPIDFLEYKD